MLNEKMIVKLNREIAKQIYEMRLSGNLVKEIRAPGQFVHIQLGKDCGALLRRPFSIASVDEAQRELTLIYRVEGAGTKKMAEIPVGAYVDVLGPLGNGFPLEACQSNEKALLVGGGVGVAPLYELSKQLKRKGVAVTHIFGFSDKSVMYYEEAFRALGRTYLATVDGSAGMKGFVTDVIQLIEPEYDAMFACGPMPMLRALEAFAEDRPVYLSLEERMGCGIGACYACVLHTADDPDGASFRKVCTDGPVFKAGEVLLA